MIFRKRLVVFSIIISCLVIVLLILFNYRTTGKAISRFTSAELEPYLEDGDIICRLGDRLWSLYFRDLSPDDKRYSHLGIVRMGERNITVINAEGTRWEGKDYVNETLLQDFISVAKKVGVYRLKGIDGAEVIEKTLEFVGTPFDWNFDLEDNGKLYCTELLYAVLKNMDKGIQLETVFQKEVGKEIIPLEAISNSSDFIEVVCLYD
ncbi:MAG: hypothetical protein LBO74_07065 [Candidatus Symbiothrix sp.]|jgi:hypothetical protein|nr:hypothetical protein [Candidatus Symbiothrix sp.]